MTDTSAKAGLGKQLYALTLVQPWATCVAYGPKRVENRKWAPMIEPPFYMAVHAGFGTDTHLGADGMASIRRRWPGLPRGHWVRGAILAVCRVAAIEPLHMVEWSENRSVSDWATGPWCWLLEDMVTLSKPVECQGQVGLWKVNGDLLDKVRYEYANAVRGYGRTTEIDRTVRSA